MRAWQLKQQGWDMATILSEMGAIGLATGIFHAARGNFIGSSVRI
jgi:hypothetical protein